MDITIHHLSGSRAGESETFSDAGPVRFGRGPDSHVKFDPERDRAVSGTHAELVASGEGWTIRDLKSTNGTYVGSERITGDRRLMPGDVVQFGKEGPKLRVDFAQARPIVPPTMVEEMPREAPAPVGRTVMMSLQPPAATPAAIPPTRPMAPAAVPRRAVAKKKGGPLRALAVVFGVIVVLLGVAFAGAFMMRQANLRKRAQMTATQQQVAQKAQQASVQVAKQSAEVAANVVKLAEAQTSTAPASNESIEDLKRQLEDSRRKLEEQQRIEDELTRKLQETNDQLATVKSQPAKVQVKYVPAPVRTSPPAARPQPQAAPPVQNSGSTPAPATVPMANTVTTTPAAAPAAAPAPQTANLYTGKLLKRKVAVSMAPSPVALTNLPSGTARDLASLLASAFESTGKFVSDQRGTASVSVAVTNFGSTTNTTSPTRAVNNASRIGSLFHHGLPTNPVDAKTTSSDAMLSLKVDLFDQAGRQLAEVQPEAEAASRASGFAVASVPFKQLAGTDTPVGDVIRKVVADAVDALTPAMEKLEWSAPVVVQPQQGTAILAAGRNAGVDIGDTFDVVDSAGRSTARIKVVTVAPETANAEVIHTASKKPGTMARYVGSESAPQAASGDRWLVTRAATIALAGPGTSFKVLKTFKAESRLRFEYAVGGWAKVTDSGQSFWVPLSSGRIIG